MSWVSRHRVFIGLVLLAVGLGASVWLAFAASSTPTASEPPLSAAQSALLVVVAAIFNVGGAWAVSRRPGSPNLTASRTAVRHLAKITTGVGELAEFAGEAFDRRPPGKGREDIGELSWRLSDVQSRLVINLEDWAKAFPDLLENPSDAKDERTEEQ